MKNYCIGYNCDYFVDVFLLRISHYYYYLALFLRLQSVIVTIIY